jgi:membrane-bound metal-dependent hydrolase YbcI (DUF457 family)
VLARSHVLVALAVWGALEWRSVGSIGSVWADGNWTPGDAVVQGAALRLSAPVVGSETLPHMDFTGRLAFTGALVALGALLPDLDHSRAWLARWRLARGGFRGWIRPFALPSHILHEQFGHRGAMHSLFAVALLLVAVQLARTPAPELADMGVPLAWGYALHLAADLLTRRGLPLFAPLWRARFSLPRPLGVRTGSIGEALYVALIILGAAAYALAPMLG